MLKKTKLRTIFFKRKRYLELIINEVGKVNNLEELKKYNLNELSQFDGKNGKAAYIGYSGKVYEVTDSIEWAEGDHLGHTAGQDLTDSMQIAPHGSEILERMKVVGVLMNTNL